MRSEPSPQLDAAGTPCGHNADTRHHDPTGNHAFEDGNKRTALLATVIFYSLEGWLLDLEQGEAVSLAVDAAEGHLDADELALLLKGRATEISLLFDPDED